MNQLPKMVAIRLDDKDSISAEELIKQLVEQGVPRALIEAALALHSAQAGNGEQRA